ncbi:uncharacterized protein LOC127845833 isoform X1 [Dreissena polymorpha]|uniref:uncharacterized protein LOC127845833 isoform X1 n=1 Tax=Dreissena polymorpha TaxID=45954 RepID=UPI0022640BB7|nr:uncharacterized protein LOC127845833 isoform X1 [Dreissena polymorpha]
MTLVKGNFETSNPGFQTDRMFENFAGMANGAEGGTPNPEGESANKETLEETAKMFAEIQRLGATTQSDDTIPLLKAMIEPTLTEEEKPIALELLMAKPREEIPDDDTGLGDAKLSVRLKEMEEDARRGRGHASGEFRPLNIGNRLGGLEGSQGGLEGIGSH